MREILRKIIKMIISKKYISFYTDYSKVPTYIFQYFKHILRHIKFIRQYQDDKEVILSKLRTSAHILDKGIHADSWERNRGRVEYDTVCSYIDALKESSFINDPSYNWAIERKVEYEKLLKTGRVINAALKNDPTSIRKGDLWQLIISRRSIRSFEQKEIEKEILIELADAVSWAPTSCNRQATKLFMTQNYEKIIFCLQQCAGATCIGNIPCFISVCADTRFYPIQDRTLLFIDAALGLQNMLLMAHAQGIEATILNWFHHTNNEDVNLRATLCIPEYYEIVVNLIIGYSSRAISVPKRKSVNSSYNIIV